MPVLHVITLTPFEKFRYYGVFPVKAALHIALCVLLVVDVFLHFASKACS